MALKTFRQVLQSIEDNFYLNQFLFCVFFCVEESVRSNFDRKKLWFTECWELWEPFGCLLKKRNFRDKYFKLNKQFFKR